MQISIFSKKILHISNIFGNEKGEISPFDYTTFAVSVTRTFYAIIGTLSYFSARACFYDPCI